MLGLTYLLYIGISLTMTFWVGRTLNKNGHVFLMENYGDNVVLAKAINSMLLVGFYMINIGFISYTLKITGANPVNYDQVLEFLSVKVGSSPLCSALCILRLCLPYNSIAKDGARENRALPIHLLRPKLKNPLS